MDTQICTQLGIDWQYRAAVERANCWKPGDVLRVKFLGGDLKLQSRVEATAKEWMEYANIQFAFNVPGASEIRIAFKPDDGSWSYVGKTCLRVRNNRPTMNLGWLTATMDRSEFRRVVLHEFGHALGLVHEHSSPAAHIPWNEKAVMDYYKRTQGWSAKMVRENVLQPEPADLYTNFDPDSIMMYPVPASLTLGGYSIPWSNDELSDQDKQFIGKLYPFTHR